MVSVGRFSVAPDAGEPATTVTLDVALSQEVAGLDEAEVHFDGARWGDPFALLPEGITIDRVVPAVAPGAYPITLVATGATLATVEFEVVAQVRPGTAIPPWVWWGPPTLIALLAGGWFLATRRKRVAPNRLYETALTRQAGRRPPRRRLLSWVLRRPR